MSCELLQEKHHFVNMNIVDTSLHWCIFTEQPYDPLSLDLNKVCRPDRYAPI